ncbi:MAG: FtsW/RodA/SpoVE family cell cycle protein, partial [Deltaproteobacteria bacterium]|nr:FtsW/RodA/SpoVE family cell cycle protein [Deltaproteobacteria bacterium]
MFDRRLVQYFDWSLLCLTLIVSFIGLMTLYSAVSAGISTPQKVLYVRQLIWYGLGLTAMIISFLFHYKVLERWAGFFYVFCILLLIAVLLFGRYIGGSRRWLTILSISIQPSELVKIAVIIVLAKYYSNLAKTTGLRLKELFIPCVLVAIPFILIVKQPDLGTAMLIVLIAASITCFVKIEKRT